MNPRQTVARVKGLAEIVREKLDAAMLAVEEMPAGGHPMLKHIRAAIERRAKAVLAGLEDKSDGKTSTVASADAALPSKAQPPANKRARSR